MQQYRTNQTTLSAPDLIAAILAFARDRGIGQAELAARAGVSAEALSRLKKAGNCRLATALDLARAAGLGAIALLPTRAAAPASAAAVCAAKLSAGRRIPIEGDELVAALAADQPPARFRVHVLGFFEELPIATVHELILDRGLDFVRLAALARRLGAEGDTVDWIDEMARDGLAPAA